MKPNRFSSRRFKFVKRYKPYNTALMDAGIRIQKLTPITIPITIPTAEEDVVIPDNSSAMYSQ
jgi:hypothetical protein